MARRHALHENLMDHIDHAAPVEATFYQGHIVDVTPCTLTEPSRCNHVRIKGGRAVRVTNGVLLFLGEFFTTSWVFVISLYENSTGNV